MIKYRKQRKGKGDHNGKDANFLGKNQEDIYLHSFGIIFRFLLNEMNERLKDL